MSERPFLHPFSSFSPSLPAATQWSLLQAYTAIIGELLHLDSFCHLCMCTDPSIHPSVNISPDKRSASHCYSKSSQGLKIEWHSESLRHLLAFLSLPFRHLSFFHCPSFFIHLLPRLCLYHISFFASLACLYIRNKVPKGVLPTIVSSLTRIGSIRLLSDRETDTYTYSLLRSLYPGHCCSSNFSGAEKASEVSIRNNIHLKFNLTARFYLTPGINRDCNLISYIWVFWNNNVPNANMKLMCNVNCGSPQLYVALYRVSSHRSAVGLQLYCVGSLSALS